MSVLELKKGLQNKMASMDAEDLLEMTQFASFLFFRKKNKVFSERLAKEQREKQADHVSDNKQFTSVLIGEREVEVEGFDDLTADQQEKLKKSIAEANSSEKFTTSEELQKKYESWWKK